MLKNNWKKILFFVLIIILLISFLLYEYFSNTNVNSEQYLSFYALDDPKLQEYVIDDLYAGLNANFDSDDYEILQISSVYISKEYLEELDYNSKSNIYFGYTLDELKEQFNGTKYVFTVGEDNKTTVKEFEFYNDNYEKMIKNVVIGSGVILTCVTLSVATGGTMAIIFAASAKTAATFALSSAAISGVVAGGIEYYNTGDINKSLEKGSLEATEGYKWGAIIGAISGGTTEAYTQIKAAKELKTMNFLERGSRAEARALQKYGGREQVSFLNGNEVNSSVPGATKPDIVRIVNGHPEAMEIKNYNLNSEASKEYLYKELKRQVTSRSINLPKDYTQRIVLDVQGRNYSNQTIKSVIDGIRNACKDVYPNIPVDVMT